MRLNSAIFTLTKNISGHTTKIIIIVSVRNFAPQFSFYTISVAIIKKNTPQAPNKSGKKKQKTILNNNGMMHL